MLHCVDYFCCYFDVVMEFLIYDYGLLSYVH